MNLLLTHCKKSNYNQNMKWVSKDIINKFYPNTLKLLVWLS